jgi:A/G-specific adenine glycosylase
MITEKQIQLKHIPWFRKRLSCWYEKRGRQFPWRKKGCTKHQVIVAEILLQRTRAETVASFYRDFIHEYPSWDSLAKAKKKELQTFLKPIGLWRQRAAAVKKLALEMSKRNGRFPKSREEIESLPAIGQYIANAVQMFCHNQPKPLLDVNMARVLERFFGPRKLADIRYDPYLQDIAGRVVPKKNAKEFNWAVLDLAALVCRPRKPLCDSCPLHSKCQLYLYTGVGGTV